MQAISLNGNQLISNETLLLKDLIAYYNDRADEYDKVYQNPLEQNDLSEATVLFQTLFSQKTVLEIACGTGYWTEQIAAVATAVDATDISERMLDIARRRPVGENTTFAVADMYNLPQGRTYDAIFGGFIWSHILLQDLDRLLDQLRNFLRPGGIIAFIDSNYVEGTNHDPKRITQTDEYDNTWQTRTLENGTTHLVLKNFPTERFLAQKLSRIATEVSFVKLGYYWVAVGYLTND